MASAAATQQATSRLKSAIGEYLRVYGSDSSQSSVVAALRSVNGKLGGQSDQGPPSPGSKAAQRTSAPGPQKQSSGSGKPPFPIKQSGTAKALAAQRFKKKGARG